MKNLICIVGGAVGSLIAYLFGGWDSVMITLCIFMVLDLLTGILLAIVFHKSPKTKTGTAESRTLFKGLCRKFVILFYVMIGHRLDIALGFDYIKTGVCISFMFNELLSITENAGLMGVPIPTVITKSIEVLKNKTERK